MADNLRVVIAAAGVGSRMKSSINKQYLDLLGKPVLTYSLDLFEQSRLVQSIVVVANSNDLSYCQNSIVKKFGYRKVAAVIPGGEERQDSVWAGINYFNEPGGYIAIHDGARPLLSNDLFCKLVQQAKEWGAAVPGVVPRDTLKVADTNELVLETLDRSRIRAIQTPQIFKYDLIVQAYRQAYADGFRGTDDASLYEKYIGRVKVVEGEDQNLKITNPLDLTLAELLISKNKG
jgi:2-C-methyl-D-erythritol 4-phosphate cytidylyltransferase